MTLDWTTACRTISYNIATYDTVLWIYITFCVFGVAHFATEHFFIIIIADAKDIGPAPSQTLDASSLQDGQVAIDIDMDPVIHTSDFVDVSTAFESIEFMQKLILGN